MHYVGLVIESIALTVLTKGTKVTGVTFFTVWVYIPDGWVSARKQKSASRAKRGNG